MNRPPAPDWETGLRQQPGRFQEVPGGVAAARVGSDYSEGKSQLPMRRPGHGTEGRPVRLFANHFLVRDWVPLAVQYRVDFQRTYKRDDGLPGTMPPLPLLRNPTSYDSKTQNPKP